MLVRVLRSVLGYVEFEAFGGFAERFINLCTLNGINLWDVKNDGVKVLACTDFGGYKKMRKCARNSGMRLKIIKKHGLSLALKHHKTRVGVAFGVVLAVAFMLAASGSVWSVKISGNTDVKLSTLTVALEDLGVYVGARKAKIDTSAVEKELVERFPELSWASVNMYGSKAEVEVREAEKSPEIEDTKTPSNLVAKKDGMVVLVKGYRGTNKVKEGDVVVKGDILISGIVENRDLTETLVRASGSVICETVTVKESAVPLNMRLNVLCEEKTSGYFSFFGIKIPLFFKKKGNFSLGRGESYVKGGSESLPIGIVWEARCSQKETDIELTKEEASLWAFFKNTEEAREELSLCDVTKLEVFEKTADGSQFCTFKATGTENIAEEKTIYRENEGAD